MSDCGKLSASIYQDCNNPITGGTKDRLVLMNFADVQSYTEDGSNPTLITAITLASGTLAYEVEGKNNSNLPMFELQRGKYSEGYNHQVSFIAFKTDAATKKQFEQMAQGRMVAIVERNYKGSGGNSAFEVYGLDSGLIMSEGKSDLADADTMGALSIVLKSQEESLEKHLPRALFLTNYATTKAIVDALLV
jgi:hypothetical protein